MLVETGFLLPPSRRHRRHWGRYPVDACFSNRPIFLIFFPFFFSLTKGDTNKGSPFSCASSLINDVSQILDLSLINLSCLRAHQLANRDFDPPLPPPSPKSHFWLLPLWWQLPNSLPWYLHRFSLCTSSCCPLDSIRLVWDPFVFHSIRKLCSAHPSYTTW